MRVRLADIAAEAAVSESTVSRVLNGKPGINEATRRFVLEIAERLGRENATVLSVPGRVIGCIVPDLDNPVFPALAQAIADGFSAAGIDCLFASRARSFAAEIAFGNRFVAAGASGLVVISGSHADRDLSMDPYRRFVDAGIPLVFVNGERVGFPATFVSDDCRESVELSITHLRSLGHERIGLASGAGAIVPVEQKITTFAARMLVETGGRDAGLIAHAPVTRPGGASAAESLVEKGCTAIVCGSDVMAFGAVEALERMGRSVPGDVSVIGYDDSPVVKYASVQLTTVRQPIFAMAEAVVEAFTFRGPDEDAAFAHFAFRPELIVRGTTGAAPQS